MVNRYSTAIVQYMRVNPEEVPDIYEHKKINLEKVLASFQSLETWQETIPVKLTVFPENILRHEYDESDPKQDQKARLPPQSRCLGLKRTPSRGRRSSGTHMSQRAYTRGTQSSPATTSTQHSS